MRGAKERVKSSEMNSRVHFRLLFPTRAKRGKSARIYKFEAMTHEHEGGNILSNSPKSPSMHLYGSRSMS